MSGLLQTAFLKALGWSLVHSLWQMGLLSLLYVLITNKGRKGNSQLRHNLALLLSGTGGIAFLITFVWIYSNPASPLLFTLLNFDYTGSIEKYGIVFQSMALMYLVVIFFLFIRFFRQFRITRQLRMAPGIKAPIELRLYIKDMASRLGIKRTVDIRLSEIIHTPLTIGFWKPVILLPVALMNHLNMEQAESILLHELNHIKRNDYLINIFIASLDILLFFNPFARFFTYTLIRERENHCDDMVLQFRYQPKEYAKALLILEQRKLEPLPVFTIKAIGKNNMMLLQRVERIIYGNKTAYGISFRLMAFLLIAVIVSSIGLNQEMINVLAVTNPIEKIVNNIETSGRNFSTPESTKLQEPIADTKEEISPVYSEVNGPSEAELQELAALLQAAEIERKLAAEAANQRAMDMAGFATVESARDFSLAETNLKTTEPAATILESTSSVPFIPGNSFSYQVIEDSTHPKKVVKTAADVQAAEDLAKTLKAIETIDWLEIEKSLKADKSKLDIVKLQLELKKALAAVDWKKIQTETTASLNMADQELLQALNYQKQIESFRKAKAAQLEYENMLKEKILTQRLQQSSNTPIKVTGKPLKKALKVVVI